MEASTIRAITRPIICLIFIGAWTYTEIVGIEISEIYQAIASIAALEWLSERAIKRFKEIFKGGIQ